MKMNDMQKTLIEDAAELFDEFRDLISAKIQQEFDWSTSTTPGLRQRLEADYEGLLTRIREFQERLEANMK